MLMAAAPDVTQQAQRRRQAPATRVGRRGCAGAVPLGQPGAGSHHSRVQGRAPPCSSARAPASRVAVKRQPGAPGPRDRPFGRTCAEFAPSDQKRLAWSPEARRVLGEAPVFYCMVATHACGARGSVFRGVDSAEHTVRHTRRCQLPL